MLYISIRNDKPQLRRMDMKMKCSKCGCVENVAIEDIRFEVCHDMQTGQVIENTNCSCNCRSIDGKTGGVMFPINEKGN